MSIYKKRELVGSFLKKGVDFKENDLVEIANEGKQIEGQYGQQDVFLIKTKDGKEGNINFNKTTINNLIDAWGENSLQWIGKQVKVWAVLSNVQGNMIKVYYFLHPDTELDEGTGQFVIMKGSVDVDSEDIPVVEDAE